MRAELVSEGNPDKEQPGIKIVKHDPRFFKQDAGIALATTNLSAALDGGVFDLGRYRIEGRCSVLRVKNPLTEEIEERLRDGHHRTASAIIEIESGRLAPTEIEYADVTQYTLRKRFSKLKSEYLTDKEYYEVLGEETKNKKELTFRRMAAHLFTDWRRWAGDDMAREFPALAALHTLGNKDYGIRTLNEAYVHGAIDSSGREIMVDEDDEKREKLKSGLKAMATRVIASGLGYTEVRFAGFELVTRGYEDIGEDIRREQISGLLVLPEIASKLANEEQRAELTSRFITTLEGIKKPKGKIADTRLEDVAGIITAITSQDFGYDDFLDFFNSDSGEDVKTRFNRIKDRKDTVRFRSAQQIGNKGRKEEQKAGRKTEGRTSRKTVVHDEQGSSTVSSEKVIATLRGLVEEQGTKIVGFQEKVATQERELAAKDETIVGLQHTVARKDGELAAKDETIVELQLTVAQQGDGIVLLREIVPEDQDGLRVKDEKIGVLQRTVDEQGSTIETQRLELVKKREAVEDLERRVAEKDELLKVKNRDIEEQGKEKGMHGANGRVEDAGSNSESLSAQPENGEVGETVIISRSQLEELEANQAPWIKTPGLSSLERAVGKADNRGLKRVFLARNTNITPSVYNEILERYYAKVQAYEKRQ